MHKLSRIAACIAVATLINAGPSSATRSQKMTHEKATSQARRVSPAFDAMRGAGFTMGGAVGDRIAANQRNWLMCASASNPAMLEMFYDRDRTPARDLNPWSGEFAGKYLTSAVECYRLSRTPSLRAHIKSFAAELIASQAADGYMGPFSEDARMFKMWDLWGQYHCMLGLFRWYQETGDQASLAACRRTADLFCRTFLDGDRRVINAGSEEMNQSCIHIFTLLYEETGEPRYLQMAREIEKDFETPPSGDYVRASLAGKPFYQQPKPRWEGLHAVQAIAELYFITGDDKYRKAYEQIWWTIDEYDRHNTGGFSSGEAAVGNPYDPRAIETCCTIAWMALTVDMLRMTGDSRAADELELSTYNGILGAQEPNGRWWTYNTPMNGDRKAATQEIAFQARPGSPELSCCSVNAPRGLGMLSDWAVMSASDGIVLNYYGPSTITALTPKGKQVRITQKTQYPSNGRVSISVAPESAEPFALHVRIPGWSRATQVKLNGEAVKNVEPGKYLVLSRQWKPTDKLDLTFDMSPRLWVGERECEGKVSIYSGPILLAYDPRFDAYDLPTLPRLDLTGAPKAAAKWTRDPKPILLLRFATEDGKGITLCDFATAGMGGSGYVSWLPAAGPKAAPYTRENPMRIVWPAD